MVAGGIGVDIKGGLGLATGHVVLDPAAIAKVLKSPDGDLYRYMFRVGDAVVTKAKAEVGVDTGNLREHIVKRMVQFPSGTGVVVVADVAYAIWHHEGSRAVVGKLMVWTTKDGFTVFATRRRAIPPNRFLVRALEGVRSMLGA